MRQPHHHHPTPPHPHTRTHTPRTPAPQPVAACAAVEEAIEDLMQEEEALMGSDAEMLEGDSDGFDSEEHDQGEPAATSGCDARHRAAPQAWLLKRGRDLAAGSAATPAACPAMGVAAAGFSGPLPARIPASHMPLGGRAEPAPLRPLRVARLAPPRFRRQHVRGG